MCRTRYLSLIIKITIYSPNSMSKNINRKMQIFIKNLKGRKGELHSEYIFLHFALIGLEWDSITLFTKNELFFLPKLTIQHHLHKIYMAFYLLT